MLKSKDLHTAAIIFDTKHPNVLQREFAKQIRLQYNSIKKPENAIKALRRQFPIYSTWTKLEFVKLVFEYFTVENKSKIVL